MRRKIGAISGGFFGAAPDRVDPAIAAITTKRTNRSDPASYLLGDTLAFRAINIGTSAERTLVGTDDVDDFHTEWRRERPEAH